METCDHEIVTWSLHNWCIRQTSWYILLCWHSRINVHWF